MRAEIDVEFVRRILSYDIETGIFLWKERLSQIAKIGNIVGTKNSDGYICVQIRGRKYLLHRIAWLYVTGSWPKEEIDHIDGDRSNNSLVNLREALHVENMFNYSKPKTNTSGFKGVVRATNCNRWVAKIQVRKKPHYLGTFSSAEKAAEAYNFAARQLCGNFARES